MPTLQEITQRPAVRIYDRTIVSERALHLYCEISRESVVLALADKKQLKYYAFEFFNFSKNHIPPEQRMQALDSRILQQGNFKNVSVQFVNRQYTLVPFSLFEDGDEEEYFVLNHRMKNDRAIYSDKVNAYHTVNVFACEKSLRDSLYKQFEAFEVHHHITAFLSNIRFQKHNGDKRMHISFSPSMLDIVVTEGKHLLLCNSFEYRFPEDALYFILLVAEQLNMDIRATQSFLSGQIEKGSPLENLLKQHLPLFSYATPHVHLAYGFDDLPAHQYLSSLSHILCVS